MKNTWQNKAKMKQRNQNATIKIFSHYLLFCLISGGEQMKDLKQVIFLAGMLDVKSIAELFSVCAQNNTEQVHEGGLLNHYCIVLRFRRKSPT